MFENYSVAVGLTFAGCAVQQSSSVSINFTITPKALAEAHPG
jgi:hypothetical protein